MSRLTLQELLASRVVIGDGAMGTMLYQHGVFLNRCFDELNVSKPALVKKIHEDYLRAGADFIETNTFGANEVKLTKYGLDGEFEKINLAAVAIACEAAGTDALVAGSIGPLGCEITEHSPMTREEATRIFQKQVITLAKAGVDFFILETFSNTEELLAAIRAVSNASDKPIVAQMTVNENGETIYGERIGHAISRIEKEPCVIAVGLNCSVGPAGMLSSLQLIRQVTTKPISIQPNAGLPRQVEGRTIYVCTPEYMAEYAKRFFEKGARIIGGCCGTTPEHIKQIAQAVRSLDKASTPAVKKSAVVIDQTKVPPQQQSATLAQKSRLGAKLSAGQKVTTIEITPPRGIDLTTILEKAQLCARLGIDAINIPDGPRASSRLSALVTAVQIQQNAGIETILHFCCRDRNLIGMQSDILGASAMGLRNLLVITGDPPKLGDYPTATGVFDVDSIALTAMIQNLNCGVDIGGSNFSPPTRLSIGVGANPVTVDFDRELERFRRKVAAGAEFAITQPVFDSDSLLKFIRSIETFSIPIIAGIWPFTSFKNAEFMANEVPGVYVPDKLLNRMSTAKTKEQGYRLGIEIARELMDEIAGHVAGFAVSAPFGNVRIALAVLGKVDINEL